MATLRDLRNRIKGVKSTQKITRAMKMVAAARLRRAQENILKARPYAKKIAEFMGRLVTSEDLLHNPYIEERDVEKVAVVVVTSDRGLCGAFNSNIIKKVEQYLREDVKENNWDVTLYCVGKKGFDHFKKRSHEIFNHEIGIFNDLNVEETFVVSDNLITAYMEGEFDKVVIIYNEFKSAAQQNLIVEQYLPLPIEEYRDEEGDQESGDANYIYEPSQKDIFNDLLPAHLKTQMWRVFLESYAAELGARMTAMDNATTNAEEMIDDLQIEYNKARQSAITTEILEVVSGAEALKSG